MKSTKVKKPYIGLRAFKVNEKSIFFGRAKIIEKLIKKLKHNKYLAIIGNSNYGKSSLINAGLINGLSKEMEGKCIIIRFTPSNDPIKSLAQALLSKFPKEKRFEDDIDYLSIILSKSPNALLNFFEQNTDIFNKNVVLIIDQFEEVFKYKNEKFEENKKNSFLFLETLTYLIENSTLPIYTVISMKTEFLQECFDFEDLARIINHSQFFIPKLSREELKESIEKPLKLFGWSIEPKLTTYILNEIGTSIDELPLMQHSLMRLWDISKNNQEKTLKFEAYKSIGGFKNALSNHADEIFNNFKEEKDKKLIEKIFKALTQINTHNKITRRALSLKELSNKVEAKKENILRVLEPFRKEGVNFIAPFKEVEIKDETIINISQESLIYSWELLEVWIREEWIKEKSEYFNFRLRFLQKIEKIKEERKKEFNKYYEHYQNLEIDNLNLFPLSSYKEIYFHLSSFQDDKKKERLSKSKIFNFLEKKNSFCRIDNKSKQIFYPLEDYKQIFQIIKKIIQQTKKEKYFSSEEELLKEIEEEIRKKEKLYKAKINWNK